MKFTYKWHAERGHDGKYIYELMDDMWGTSYIGTIREIKKDYGYIVHWNLVNAIKNKEVIYK